MAAFERLVALGSTDMELVGGSARMMPLMLASAGSLCARWVKSRVTVHGTS